VSNKKLAPKLGRAAKKQILRMPYTLVFKEPVKKRRKGKGTKDGKIWIALHAWTPETAMPGAPKGSAKR
jgi:hypothetical protein